jgi:hypothetical protein
MTTSESFRALRRANPRGREGFAQAVDAVEEAARRRVAAPAPAVRSRRRVVAGASLAAAAVVAALAVVLPAGGPAVGDAQAAVERAATVTAAEAERSGTAVVRMTRDGQPWAGSTIRWHGDDLSVSNDLASGRGRGGMLLVDGMLYGSDADGWFELGSPASIDPDSGTTPAEYLAAARDDVGGTTLRRIADGLTGSTATSRGDGSTVYSGTIAAGLIATEPGFKEGRAIRVLPFGYVAHDEAASPSAPLDLAVTVGADGVVRELAVSWGERTAWTYTVTYGQLGSAPALAAPADARPLRRD